MRGMVQRSNTTAYRRWRPMTGFGCGRTPRSLGPQPVRRIVRRTHRQGQDLFLFVCRVPPLASKFAFRGICVYAAVLNFVNTGAFETFMESDPAGFCMLNLGATCPGGFSHSATVRPIFSGTNAKVPVGYASGQFNDYSGGLRAAAKCDRHVELQRPRRVHRPGDIWLGPADCVPGALVLTQPPSLFRLRSTNIDLA